MVNKKKEYQSWLIYLSLSVCVNAQAVSAVNPASAARPALQSQALKITLLSRAAPVAQSKEGLAPSKPQTKPLPKMDTQKKAEKKIAVKTPRKAEEAKVRKRPTSAPKQKQLPSVQQLASQDVGVDRSTVLHEARYRRQSPPLYPKRALALGQEGTVMLHAEVMPNGHPGELKIVRSSGHRLLDIAALSAVKKWEFEPLRADGHAIASWVKVPVRFIIK